MTTRILEFSTMHYNISRYSVRTATAHFQKGYGYSTEHSPNYSNLACSMSDFYPKLPFHMDLYVLNMLTKGQLPA